MSVVEPLPELTGSALRVDRRVNTAGTLVVLALALAGPALLASLYWLHTMTTALVFVVLGLAFNLVFGRAGALSMAQPLFYAVGAYIAALGSTRLGWTWWTELLVAVVTAAVLAVAVGIPSFRLSQHTFAIGTLGFTLIGQLVATNWIDVTGGPLCAAGVPDLTIRWPGGSWTAVTEQNYYYVALALAVGTVALLSAVYRSRLGRIFSAVRDDPVLASARGVSPTGVRLTAFGLAGALTAVAGTFMAHLQRVVCPSQGDMAVTNLLLIMVLVGGIGSTRGVALAALLVTVVPQMLRLADEWRMVIFSLLLLVVVIFLPRGLAGLAHRPVLAWCRLLERHAQPVAVVEPATAPVAGEGEQP